MLGYHLGGKDITEVLAMSVTEALVFFADGNVKIAAVQKILGRMADVGHGYLTLGQPSTRSRAVSGNG